MSDIIRVGILDDHLSIIDGYLFRLAGKPGVEVIGSANYGNDLEPMLAKNQIDVLLLDLNVPISKEVPNPFPILHKLPGILSCYPKMRTIVISMHSQRTLIKALIEKGVSGYINKDDSVSIKQLHSIVSLVANGGTYFGEDAHLQELIAGGKPSALTARQLEALSLCAAYPDISTTMLAIKLDINSSSMRNLLSGAYLRLGVRTRAAATIKAQQLGLIPSSAANNKESGL